MTQHSVTRLFPSPQTALHLEGLYLQHAVQHTQTQQCPCVYTNFISSLDGRIAVEHPDQDGHNVPGSITNPRDWRLYQELAAQADVLLASARYLRELSRGKAQDVLPLSTDGAYDDLHDWRRRQGLPAQPAVAIISGSLDLPLDILASLKDRDVYVVTGEQADNDAVERITGTGARVLRAGPGRGVEGRHLVDALAGEGLGSIYSIAGPGVMETLLNAGVLNRLYLTQVHRLIGGETFDTLLEGGLKDGPLDFNLVALYFDQSTDNPFGQFFSIYESGHLRHAPKSHLPG